MLDVYGAYSLHLKIFPIFFYIPIIHYPPAQSL
nr:MAG TPA: hypothetical protein [Caudoviricetes sp.]